MFTTDGTAFFAASLNEKRRGFAITGAPAAATLLSRTSTTCVRQGSQSGFTRLSTKSTASVAVTAWAKRSQSLRMPLFSHQRVADLGEQPHVLGRRGRRLRRLAAQAVDVLHHQENDEREDDEVHQDVEEVAPRDHR